MRIPYLAIDNYQFTLVAYVALLVLGLGALSDMPISEDPPLEPPGASIVVFHPGTSPLDMERLIVEPLEEGVNELDDIKELTSSIRDGIGVVRVEFEAYTDAAERVAAVREKMNQVRPELPGDLESIEVTEWSATNVTVMQLALLGKDASYRDLYEEARRIERIIERIDGVKRVTIEGYADEIVRVDVDLERLAARPVSLMGILAAVAEDNENLPGGSVDLGPRRFNVRTSGAFSSLDDIRRTIVYATGSHAVYLGDVADVNFGYEDPEHITRFNGRRCVFVSVYQKVSADVFAVNGAVKARLPDIRRALPPGMELEIGFDQSSTVGKRVESFGWSLLQGIALVGAGILLVVGVRSALVVIVAIPASFLIGIGFVYLVGFGLHQMTIAGLVIALGLLVDNAIVVTENAARLRREGATPREAATLGTSQVAWPLVSSTATTVLAFLPLLLIPDTAGDFIRALPVAVVFTVGASLLVALTLSPLLLSKLLPAQHAPGPLEGVVARVVDTHYRRWVETCVRHGGKTLLAALLLFLASLALFTQLGVSFFPKADKDQFIVDVEMVRGTSLSATDEAVVWVESVLREQPETVATLANTGRGNPKVYYNLARPNNSAHIGQVFTTVDSNRGRSVREMVSALRGEFSDFPAGRIRVREFQQGPQVDAPIVIRILGDNLGTLAALASDVEEMIRGTRGTLYVDNPLQVGSTDLRVRVNRDKVRMLGLAPIDVDRTVRAAIAGVHASTYRDDKGKSYDIVLRLPVGNSPDLGAFDRIYVTAESGAHVPLRQLARIELERGPAGINHYHLERTAVITSDVDGRSVDEVTSEIMAKLAAYSWPPNYRYEVGGEIESRQASFGGLGQAVLLALVSIYGILVLQFRSFALPLVIFSAVPLAVVGSVVALLLSGYAFSFTAFLGITSLVGIVINDSILLVDSAEALRHAGRTVRDAAIEAGKVRFVPVLLTSATTIAGLLPLTLRGGEMWAPMGWAIIGGLATATALVLLVVPVLYTFYVREEV